MLTDLLNWLLEAWYALVNWMDRLDHYQFHIGKQAISPQGIINAILLIVLSLQIAFWVSNRLEKRLLKISSLTPSLRMLIARLMKAVLLVVATLISLSAVGVDMTALSVFTGALGVGLGMGLQRIASSYVSGFIILLDSSIQLGDVVQLDANTNGVVTEITTRYTVLRNAAGSRSIVPNENLVSSIVHNLSFSDKNIRLKTNVSVAYATDLEPVLALLESIAHKHPRVLADPEPRALISSFGDNGIDLELGFWINDPESGTGNVVADINLEIWREFKTQGVDIPFPQRELRIVERQNALP